MMLLHRRSAWFWYRVSIGALLLVGACKKQEPAAVQPSPEATPEVPGEPPPTPPVADSATTSTTTEADTPSAPAPDAAPATPPPPAASSMGIVSKPALANGRFVVPALYQAGDDSPSAGTAPEGAAGSSGGRLAEGSRALYTIEFNPDGSARELLGDAYGGGNYVVEGNTVTFSRFESSPGAPVETRRFTTNDEFQTLVERDDAYRYLRRLVTPFAFQGPAGEVLACLDFGGVAFWKTASGQESGQCLLERSGDTFSLRFDGPTPRNWTIGEDGKSLTGEGGAFSLLEAVPPELAAPPSQ